MLNIPLFTQLVFVIGRVAPSGVIMLGTGVLVQNDGSIATTYHVIGSDPTNLVVLMPNTTDPNTYQDLSDLTCNYQNATVTEIDPARDVAILKTGLNFSGTFPQLSNFDSISVGADVGIFGFPHCVQGRRTFTFQRAEIGAKVLLDNQGVKSRHAVINVQARPGQSGSAIVNLADNSICGLMIGAWVPGQAGISLGGINPHELHQTTHCISAQHLREML